MIYELRIYHCVPGRLPDLLDEWSVRRLVEAGANAIKILLYYNPDDDARRSASRANRTLGRDRPNDRA